MTTFVPGSFAKSALMELDCFFSFCSIKQCKWSTQIMKNCSCACPSEKYSTEIIMGFLNRMCLSYTLSDGVCHQNIFQANMKGERKKKWEGTLGMCPGAILFLIVPSLLLLLDISEIRKKEF